MKVSTKASNLIRQKISGKKTITQKRNPWQSMQWIFLFLGMLIVSNVSFGQYTPGKLAVAVVGDGSAALSNAATPVFIKEFNTSGTSQSGTVRTTLPTTAVGGTSSVDRALTQSGSATSEGFLNLSANRQFLTLGGYNVTSGTTGVASTAATTFPTNTRVIGKVGVSGTADTKTTLFTSYSANNLRSAITSDGTNYWTAGPTTGGIFYTTNGSVAAPTTLSNTNTRGIGIFNNQLYASASSGSLRLMTVGTGLPTTTGQTVTNLSGFPTSTTDPYSYVFLNLDGTAGPDVVYIASLGTAPTGILKYTSADQGATWTSKNSLTGNAFGITGVYNSCTGNVDLYYTSSASGTVKPTTLYKFTDVSASTSTLSGALTTGTLLATAATNTAFGGVAFTPTSTLIAPAAFSVTGGNACFGASVTVGLSSSETGVSYQLFNGASPVGSAVIGTGSAISFGSQSATGTYTVVATNNLTGCTTTMTGSSIIHSLPTVSFSGLAASYCSTDAAATLTGSPLGGTFSGPGISGNSFDPATAGVGGPYTITYSYTDANGCTNTSSQTVSVISCATPLAVTGIVTNVGCPGASTGAVDITATGGTAPYTYSWSNSATTEDISGLTAGSYTVTVTDAVLATVSQTFTVGTTPDLTNPTITAPVNVSACTNTGCTAVGVMLGVPVTSDNCSVASVTNNAPAAFPLGTTTVTWTVTDGSSNTATATQTVTITDNTAPSIYFNTPGLVTGVTGPSSSASPYVLPLKNGVKFKSILSVADNIGGYQMAGIPDGLGAFDNCNGTFTLLMNHEFGNTIGAVHAHGAIGSFVSKWVINKSNLQVISGSDLMQTVYGWNVGTQSTGTAITFAFNRFCSADLPAVSAFYNAATGLGTKARIYMHGEEGGATGYQLGTVASGPDAGKSYILGKFNLTTNNSGLTGVGAWENALANPFAQNKTIVIGLNDGGTGIMNNSLSLYDGTKQSTGSEVDKAGLNNGTLSFINVTGNPVEIVNISTRATNIVSGTAFTLSGTTSTTFSRPEDGTWDPADPSKFYFVTTDQLDQVADGIGAQVGRSRLWRLNFTDITNPALGGTIDMLLDGTEGHNMLDNLTIDNCGHLLLQEDVGNAPHNGKVWQYTIATDALLLLAKHDPARFGDRVSGVTTAATAPYNQDEETSGIIDVSEILGKGMHLLVDQAHYATGIPSALAEGGQLLAMFNPESACGVVAGDATDTVRVCSGAGAVSLGTPATSDNCSVASLTNNAPPTFPVGNTTVIWTATDGSGNTTTANQIVMVSNLSVSAAAGTITCNGGTTTLTATATGGSGAPLQYSLNSGPPYQLSNTFTVGAGDFVVTVLDANGCTATTSITISQPVALVATATAPPITTVGGTTTVTVDATGGTAPYSGTGTFVRSAGTYNFTVTDANGCVSIASITLTNPLANASLNILTQNSGQVTQGGIVNIEVTVGNTGPTGAIGANKVRAQISVPIAIANILPNAQQTGLPSGWTITVNNGGAITICNGSDVIPVGASRTILIKVQGNTVGGPSTVNGNLLFSNGASCTAPGSLSGDNIADNSSTSSLEVLPCSIAVTASAGTIACNGGTTTLTAIATGANGPAEYSLNGGAYQLVNTFTVNAAGSPYTVVAREVNNTTCSATATAVTVTEPTLLVASSSATAILCNGGNSTVTVTATGGTTPYTGTGTFTVGAGTHNYTVTDANGCTSVTSVTITQPTAISVSATPGTIICNGGTTTLTVTASGGTGTLQYSLNSGPPYQLSNTFTVGAGDFTVTVKDANGCLATTSLTISQPVALVATSTAPPITVVGGTTTVTVSATGGTAPYSGTGAFVRSAGTHNFTVTDANGCTSITSITLANPLANASINILTQNSGQVTQGGIVNIEVTVGNTGPTGAIGANKVRAQISVPIAIANILPNAQQTGLPSGWTITVNNGGAITICNGSDVIPVGASRTILIKVQGNNIGGPSTVNGNLLFSNGTSCTLPGSLPGDNIADNSSTSSLEVIPAAVTVNLKLFLQGYYIDGGIMQPVLNNHAVPGSLPNETDTIGVELHNATTFALVDSKKAVLLTDGTTSASFTQPAGSYYIAIKHRNTLQTWSANPVSLSNSATLYSFSSAATQAFGDNQVLLQTGIWGMMTGDLNQDDYIDGNDFPQYDFESASGGLYDGTYTVTDMNGDGFVDGNDFPVYDGNSSISASAIYPQ